ncbi:ABC transporter ATP-binding protein [Bacillus salacetis]|uniref:ABC transporter ATP-binding protein n=1 Tax=Bacillus salacetis TaxID=2315464 RepID=A0A3A1R045_9BACI|nr:ABC transporter ATP-binding protein [Bacillus salacetis]RIW34018.1 ABC transporter ATP-binding protein [Bacillus salacetis]
MNVVECKGLQKKYGRKTALKEVSFILQKDKITGLIGRNGAGKTTLLKIIAGYIKESSGDIRVFEEKPFNNLKVSANMIFIDDEMNLPPTMNLEEILQTAEDFYPNWDRELARRLFDYFSFKPYQYHNGLSKGMRSTFNMILGLAARTPLTIFDEPTTGMDAGVRKDFYRALLKDYLAHPRTIILSSHLLNEIEDILEDILLIKDGEKFLHLPVEELREYAIGVKGKDSVMQEWLKDKEVIHESSQEIAGTYAVVRHDFPVREIETARRAGLEFSPISADEICTLLTTRTKGGIDDVFNRG